MNREEVDMRSTTIVNLKIGARMTLDDYPGSVYVGWGTALTSWRYRRRFSPRSRSSSIWSRVC